VVKVQGAGVHWCYGGYFASPTLVCCPLNLPSPEADFEAIAEFLDEARILARGPGRLPLGPRLGITTFCLR